VFEVLAVTAIPLDLRVVEWPDTDFPRRVEGRMAA